MRPEQKARVEKHRPFSRKPFEPATELIIGQAYMFTLHASGSFSL